MSQGEATDGRRVLLIDDEPAFQGFVRLCVAEVDAGLDVASDAVTGLDMAATRPYGVILLDLALPRTNGLDLIERLRLSSRAPIVVVTGLGTKEIQADAIRRGAMAVLNKPFKIATLVAMLSEVLSSSK